MEAGPAPGEVTAEGSTTAPEREVPRASTPEEIETAWGAFLSVIGWDQPIPIPDSTLEIALALREKQRELARERPELRDYPFLDPVDDAPTGDWREYSEYLSIVDQDYWYLKQGQTMDDFIGPPTTSAAGTERRLEAALQGLRHARFVATLPPEVLAQNPYYGEAVSEEAIREKLPLLQSLRLEYLHAIAPFLAEQRQLRRWRNMTQGRGVPPGLPPDVLPDPEATAAWVEQRMQELDAEMDVYRRRYLRALGEAIGAPQLPPVD